MLSLLSSLLLVVPAVVLSTPLDDYVWKEDSNYGWGE
jgi:hypothetical protein